MMDLSEWRNLELWRDEIEKRCKELFLRNCERLRLDFLSKLIITSLILTLHHATSHHVTSYRLVSFSAHVSTRYDGFLNQVD